MKVVEFGHTVIAVEDGDVVASYDAIDLAMKWFRMDNDTFFEVYGFNWVPHGAIYDTAKRNVERREAAEMERMRMDAMMNPLGMYADR